MPTVGTVMKVVGVATEMLGVSELAKLGEELARKGIEAHADKVEVPEIYGSDYRLTLDEAKRWIIEDGLNPEPVVAKPDIAYKDCQDMEVVATNFQLKQKVKPGTRIILRYVTAEIIEASKKLYDDLEKERADVEQKKVDDLEELARKKAEQREKNKEKINTVAVGFQQGVNEAAGGIRDNLKKMTGRFAKNTASEIPESGEGDG